MYVILFTFADKIVIKRKICAVQNFNINSAKFLSMIYLCTIKKTPNKLFIESDFYIKNFRVMAFKHCCPYCYCFKIHNTVLCNNYVDSRLEKNVFQSVCFLVAKLLYKSKCPSVCPYFNHV